MLNRSEWLMTIIMYRYVASHANANPFFSPWSTTGSGSVWAGGDICVCHLGTTTRTSGGLQGKAWILKHIIGCTTVTSTVTDVHINVWLCHLSFFFGGGGVGVQLVSGSALTCWSLSNCCQYITDSVTNTLKINDLRRAAANKNDQAHCKHGHINTNKTIYLPKTHHGFTVIVIENTFLYLCKNTLLYFFLSQLVFGLLSVDRKLWKKVLVQSTSSEINDLNPGSDYGLSIQSVLGSDTSRAVHREFSTRKRHTHAQKHTTLKLVHLQSGHEVVKLQTFVDVFQAQLDYAPSIWAMWTLPLSL